MEYIAFPVLGLFIGFLGTLIGAGGGFILMPILIFLFPDKSPERLTHISLGVVCFNAISGTIAYAHKRRIDYQSGIIFAVASLPGAVLGAILTTFVSRPLFEPIFGGILLTLGTYLLALPMGLRKKAQALYRPNQKRTKRIITERSGHTHEYDFHMLGGIILSILVGIVASFLGIGGGIIHVPGLVQLLNFPVHIATATSHFVLGIVAFAGFLTQTIIDPDPFGLRLVSLIAPGVIIGAQLGAKFSDRVKGPWIIRALAFALASVGIRLLFK